MPDDGGVLENLPHSRPGRRSAKRERPPGAADKGALRAEESGQAAAQPPPTSRANRASTKSRRTTAVKGGSSKDRVRVFDDMDQKRGHDSPRPAGDPFSAAVRGAAGLTVAGVKVAGAVTHELLRRLPRP